MVLFQGRVWLEHFTGHCLFFGPENALAAAVELEAAGFEVEHLELFDPYDDSVRFVNIKRLMIGGDEKELWDDVCKICSRHNGDFNEGGFNVESPYSQYVKSH